MVPIKLLPTSAEATAFDATLRTCNEAANWVSQVAFNNRCYREYDLRKRTYYFAKARWRLSGKLTQHAIKKVVEAYASLHGNIKAGNYGKVGSKQRIAVESKPIKFRWNAAQTYDLGSLSWQPDTRTVSIQTTAGRLKHIPLTGSPAQIKAITELHRCESDLVYRD